MTSSGNSTPDATIYRNGTRGTNVGASLERSAGFRVGQERRLLSSAPKTLKSGSTSAQSGSVNLLQSLRLDFNTVIADQKLPRQGEIKRAMSSLFGTSREELVSVSGAGRHLPSIEEIKRLKVNLLDSSRKARERGKLFGDGIFKMDKYTRNLPRKRSRGNGLSSERDSTSLPSGSFSKISPQTHSNADGMDPVMAEDRAKNAVQNKRIHTSMSEVDARMIGFCGASGPIERNKDAGKLACGASAVAEEKGRGLVTSIDGWEKPKMMKKKRSVIKSDGTTNVALSKSIDGDREPTQGTKLVNDPRPMLTNLHGFRSNICEGDYVASPASTAKVSSSARGPRSNPALLSKASLNIRGAKGNSGDWENPSSLNMLNTVGGAVNFKRSKSAHAASPPVAQWGGQRPQKTSRIARRAIPIIASQNGTPVSDPVEPNAVEDALGFPRRTPANAFQQIKGDHGQSTGLSESEESADNKSKDKIKRSEKEDDVGHDSQKIKTPGFPSRKNKMNAYEYVADGAPRQGSVGGCLTSIGSGVEKLDGVAATMQRSIRIDTERNERTGRPLLKQFSEPKDNMPSRNLATTAPLDFPGRPDDDNEELLAAANAALNTKIACSKATAPFWKGIGRIFSFVSEEDIAYLNQQICQVDGSTASGFADRDDNQNSKGNLECISVPSTLAAGSNDNDLDPLLEELLQPIQIQRGVSICHTLLSAIIQEEEVECIIDSNGRSEVHPFDSHGSHLEFGGISRAAERVCNGFIKDSIWKYPDEPGHITGRRNDAISGSGAVYPNFQYNQMCFSDRIILELSEIGLCPESVPALAQSEDEDIADQICKLRAQLHNQVTKKKNLLLRLQKDLMAARECQIRELVRRAVDKLAIRAYEKHMACRCSNSSARKNTNGAAKDAALTFVERTLAHCRKFEETGVSCFDEPVFTEMFLSIPRPKSDEDYIVIVADEGAARRLPVPSSLQVQRTDTSGKCSDTSQYMEDIWPNGVKRKKVLIDDVAGGARGTKGKQGKRSDRDRDGKAQKRVGATTKIGRPSLSHARRGERKNKMKPKQKTTHLSASVNGLLSSAPKTLERVAGDGGKKNDLVPPNSSSDGRRDMSADAEMADLSNFQLSEIDVGDFGGQEQDIGSWLNVDDDGLQDFDCMEGLQIPMDDLSEVKLLI